VREDQSFIAIASNGMMVRSPVNEVRIIGRAAKGVRLVNLAEDATLVSVSIADPDDDESV
jgi:DNA gyrase subunit A